MDVEQVADRRLLKAREHAKVAGACRLWAIFIPDAASGLIRCARQHDAVAAALLEEFIGERANVASRPLPLAHAPTGGPHEDERAN